MVYVGVSFPALKTAPSRVQISGRGLPTVWSEGRQINLQYCINNRIKPDKKVKKNSVFFLPVPVISYEKETFTQYYLV